MGSRARRVKIEHRVTLKHPLRFPGASLEVSTSVERAPRSARRINDYVMVYLKRGSHLSSSPWRGEFEAAKTFAREGLVRRSADEYQIRSGTLDGPLMWRELRDVSTTSPYKP